MPAPDPRSLLTGLRSLHSEMQASMRRRFDRDLPFEELVFDRWDRARALGFGEGTSVYHGTYIFGDVRVGENTWIGPLVMLDGSGGGIDIGDWCCVSAGTHVYTHDTMRRSLTGGRAPADAAAVHIGDRSYIGSQAVIVPGVTVGEECVVGAGAMVTRDVPRRSIVVGVPARVRGHVTLDPAGERAELHWDH
jgi:acetyltransferase-like isoleucine patch superfamily enzyme